MKASARASALPQWLMAPSIIVMLAFVALPLLMTLSLSVQPFLPDGRIGDGWTGAHFADIARDDYFHTIFARTFGMALLVTLACIAIGVPEAYVLSRLGPRWRAVSMVVVLGPLLISVVVRTLGRFAAISGVVALLIWLSWVMLDLKHLQSGFTLP